MPILIRKDDEPISPSLCEFGLETESKLSELPTSTKKGADGQDSCYPGSVAYLLDAQKVWMLGLDDVWHQIA